MPDHARHRRRFLLCERQELLRECACYIAVERDKIIDPEAV
jgi:hypothetical protein